MSPADYSLSAADSDAWTHEQLAELRRKVIEYFSEEELRTLCFDIGVDYESLPAQGKEGKARELVALQWRQGQLAGLVAACCTARPNVRWEPDESTSWPAPPPRPPGPEPVPGPGAAGFQPVGRWQMQVSDGSAWLLTFFPNGSFMGQGIGMWWGAGAQASGGWTFFIPVQTLQLQGMVNNVLPIVAVLVFQPAPAYGPGGQPVGGHYALGNDGRTYVFTRV